MYVNTFYKWQCIIQMQWVLLQRVNWYFLKNAVLVQVCNSDLHILFFSMWYFKKINSWYKNNEL